MESIGDLLRRVLSEVHVAWTRRDGRQQIFVGHADPAPTPPPDPRRVAVRIHKLLEEAEWHGCEGAYQEVQAWVDIHWSEERDTTPPSDSVLTDSQPYTGPRPQLDTQRAARKLILAAMAYGPETVARHAVEFARHGMIEVQYILLLLGRAAGSRIPLDRYCTLLPHREALQGRQLVTPWTPDDVPWLPDDMVSVSALLSRTFEYRGKDKGEVYASPLWSPGDRSLELMLGVVWGDGYRMFGDYSSVPPAVAAALPFLHVEPIGGGSQLQALLPFMGYKPEYKKRPLPCRELAALLESFAHLPKQTQKRLSLAMRRLSDSAGRVNFEDRVVDVCIALEALFTHERWESDLMTTVSRRGSWYYADSTRERDHTRETLKGLYCLRRAIVHGNTVGDPMGVRSSDESTVLLRESENILRTCLKSMVAEGMPDDWEVAEDQRSVWRSPLRSPSEIPSVKSDSMSWSVAEQKEIDKALESVWRASVKHGTPTPPSRDPVSISGAVKRATIQQYQDKGIHLVVIHPARLFPAHPKWPKAEDDPLDERTKYYCSLDVERHMDLWCKAASERRLSVICIGFHTESSDTDALIYLPKHIGTLDPIWLVG